MRPRFSLVFFDCDSTLSAVEGVDELAREAGMLDEIAALTSTAMEGGTRLEEVYARRLELIRPSREAVERLGDTYVAERVDGAAEVVSTLAEAGAEVHVVSGGLRLAVSRLAESLGIPEARVHAVDLRFDPDGAYAGFAEDSPLARSMGKAEVCGRVLSASSGRAAIVGDGHTDAEAAPPCSAFIGFGGVVARAGLRELADHWVEGPSLRAALPFLLESP